MENDIYSKYGIQTDGLQRYYVYFVKEKRLDLNTATPVELAIILGQYDSDERPSIVRLNNNTWIGLLTSLITLLQKRYPKTKEELLAFDVSWSSAKVFRETKDIVNMVQLDNGLYFSVNHSSNHSYWLIYELLQFYKINVAYISIHRPPFAEPKEVRDYVKNLRLEQFKNYLINDNSVTEEKANKIIRAINEVFNKVVKKITQTAYDDFFLFDDCIILSTIKSKFLAKVPYATNWSEGQIKTAKKYLDYLTSFYRKLRKEADKNINALSIYLHII